MKNTSDNTRDKLIHAALLVFSEKGFNSTRLSDVAERAGVSRGAFYWYFKNKYEIYSAVIDETLQQIVRDIKNIFAENLPIVEKVRQMMRHLAHNLLDNPEFRAISVLHFNIERSQEMRTLIENNLIVNPRWGAEEVINELRKGLESGEFRPDVSIQNLDRALNAFLYGLVNLIIDAPEPIGYSEIDKVIDCFIGGIQNKTKDNTGQINLGLYC